MKAIVRDRYGSPDVLAVKDVKTPVPGDGEVLVGVKAAAVSIGDCHLLTGVPYVMRLATGLRKPRRAIPGMYVAGRVEGAGPGVEDLRRGDEVFGWCHGGFAKYVCVPDGQLLPKPPNLGFDQAAAVDDSALTALAAVRDHGMVQPGQDVLITAPSVAWARSPSRSPRQPAGG